jgi:glycosyltransferase involved in cell wall biosynthesis
VIERTANFFLAFSELYASSIVYRKDRSELRVALTIQAGSFRLNRIKPIHSTVFTGGPGESVPLQSDGAREASETLPRVIVFFDHTALMSGGEIALLHLVQHLDRRRYLPVVVLSAEGPLLAKLVDSGVETHVLPLDESVSETRKDSLGGRGLLRPSAALNVVRYAWRLARFLKARKADLLHTNSLKSDVIGGVAGRLARIPVVWHIRDRIATDYLPKPAVSGFRWLCRILPNYIITNSEATLKTLCLNIEGRAAVIHSGVTKTYVRVVHDGVEDEVAPGLRIMRSADEGPIIGLVGRLSPWKGQHIFLAAAAQVYKEFPSTRFQIIGSAMFGEEAYEAQVRELCVTLGLSDCVEFLGFRKDVPALIAELDILVHASTLGEPFGQVVVEGMVAGKPVVATNGGGVPEIVEEGVTGWLVPMGESAPMAEAIMRLLRDPERAGRMGTAGRTRVLEHFTIELTAQSVQEVYEQFWSDHSVLASR